MMYDPYERYQSAPPLDPIEPSIRVSLFSKQTPLQLDLQEETLLREKGTIKKRAIQKFHHNVASLLHRKQQSRAKSAGLYVESQSYGISQENNMIPRMFWSEGDRLDRNIESIIQVEITQSSHRSSNQFMDSLKNDGISAQNNESTADNSIDELSKEQLNNEEIKENASYSQQLDNVVVNIINNSNNNNNNNNNNNKFQLSSFN